MLTFSRASLDAPLLFAAISACLSALVALARYREPVRLAPSRLRDLCELCALAAAALTATVLLAGPAPSLSATPLLLATFVFAGLCMVLRIRVARLNNAGIAWHAAQILAVTVATGWSALFIGESDFPGWFRIPALIGLALGTVVALAAMAGSIARDAAITHERWRRPVSPGSASAKAAREPKVSLHLPCYSEPPAVVMGTMDRLAALAYANFEVLVCDNNTPDEALWRPLEAHCTALNRQLGRTVFRFFHVAPLEGAKAGALNFCLDVMARDTEIVGVIDADYHATRDFLSRLVPHFDDANLGYIQTPHDYRGYAGSPWLTACHWEYMPVNKVDWRGISEYGGAFTIGTMCLLRAQALRDAGGWAEWCLTEDSEVSVRMRATGWHGLYFNETFGRGLIPETFDDYRKQRFRWTAGPVQQLRRHWRLFLPQPIAGALPGWSKLLEVLRCVAPLQRMGALVLMLAGTVFMGLAQSARAGDPVDIPNVVWALMILGGMTWCARTAHRYRLSGCHEPRDMVLGEIARASLTWIVLLGGVAGLSRRPLAWRRTPKFAVSASRRSPFADTAAESVLGALFLALTVTILAIDTGWGSETEWLLALQLASLSAAFLCAPVMSWLAQRHARQASRANHKQTTHKPAGSLHIGPVSAPVPTTLP
ncbi:glucosyl transferase [Novosphingobium sp. MD-1]|nr:glucosyl transferase [Novosphingobium sp. MD-1]